MEHGICLVADLLGFRQLVYRTEDAYQAEKVDRWINIVDVAARRVDIDRYQLISDSLFAVAPQDRDGVGQLIAFSRDLLTQGLEVGLPVRGALARGLIRWGERIVHGPAVVAAYELESGTNWIGIACNYSFPEIDELYEYRSLVQYPAPVKRGARLDRPCIVWPVPEDGRLMQACTVRDGEGLSDDVTAKIRETARFRDYLKWLAKNHDSHEPSRFHGTRA